MRVSKLGLLAAAAMTAGVAGCALPEVLPMAGGGTTQGPSPYGVWYEQHWATNAVLLAAADQPEADQTAQDEEAEIDKALADFEAADEAARQDTPVEANADLSTPQTEEFSNSSPYQFPASQFQEPAPQAEELTPPPPPPAPEKNTQTVPDGPIRY
jgi:hypothetical protein